MENALRGPLVECVPNFSEGRNPAAIAAIASAIRSVPAVALLHEDAGFGAHRCVMTFAGPPEDVLEAAFRSIREAVRRIDIRRHRGPHPRFGAADVCPLIPLRGVSMEECVALSRRLGERLGGELGLPVFLYERSASRPEREDLARVRRGGFEGLSVRMAAGDLPDFGPPAPHPSAGAIAVGARDLLIAFNINLDTARVDIAQRLAEGIRERGGARAGNPRRLAGVKALGWWMPEYGHAQVTCNLTDYRRTGLLDVFAACEELAREEGVRATGSELVGLVPQDALAEAGRRLLAGESQGGPEASASAEEAVDRAVRHLGIVDFDPDSRILERVLEAGRAPDLGREPLRSFLARLRSGAPVPGGGAVAALSGALGAALASMVANLSAGSDGAGEAEALAALEREFLAGVDGDARGFLAYLGVLKRPKAEAGRAEALLEAALEAARWPARIIRLSGSLAEQAQRLYGEGTPHARSDAVAAALAAGAAAAMALCQVVANLRGLGDGRASALLGEAAAGEARVREAADRLFRGYAGMEPPCGPDSREPSGSPQV